MNKRKQLKILKSYLTNFCARHGQTKEEAIRGAVFVKERYLKAFINYIYKKYGEGDINEDRFIIKDRK